MYKKPLLPFLETMITQVCNLSCPGCSNYSDIKHSGYVTWDNGSKQLKDWLNIIDITDFGIMGGEPLINPEWRKWLVGVRNLLPDAQIRFTTNGLLLDRARDILDICNDIGNVILKITVHVNDSNLESYIDQIYKSAEWKPVVEYGISRHVGKNNVRFQVNRPTQFLKTYQGMYDNMKPWNSNSVDAFNLCIQQTCPLLHEGKIYKCSTAGLLKETLARYKNPNWQDWQPYIDHGISPTDPEEAIVSFINNFGKPNKICAQCPDKQHGVIEHSTVLFKSIL